MNPTPPSIVFDLDGTLVDTAPDLAAAMNHVLAHFGRAPVDPEAVRHMVGHGARRTIERGLALTGGGDEAMLDAGVPVFLEFYGANVCVGSRPWEGVEASLTALADAGARIAICTNKPERLAVDLIDALGWGDLFDAILGGDSLPVRKPDPAHVLETLARMGGDPARAAFVGDSRPDVEASRAAGVPVVLTSFGYSDVPPDTLGADAMIDHFDALVPTLKRVAPALFV
jgi:phosphoglycolate phosphatase